MTLQSISKLYTPYGVDVAGTFLSLITDWAVPTNIETEILKTAGAVDPTHSHETEEKPQIKFTSNAIAECLGVAGLGGFEIVSGSILTTFLQRTLSGGAREGTLKHCKLEINKGLLVPGPISCENNKAGTIEMIAHAVYDGTNDPIKTTLLQTLIADDMTTEAFTCGPVIINGATLEGIQRTTITPNVEVFQPFGSGEHRPTYISIDWRKPEITVETTDTEVVSTIGLSGVAISSSTVVYLRKMLDGGSRTPDATAEHISFTATEGIVQVEDTPGSDKNATSNIKIEPTFDGTLAILQISTAVALP